VIFSSRVLTADKIGFQANFANKNKRQQKTNPVQNNKPKSGKTKSILYFLFNCQKISCRRQPH
jgi:hypothetical protein